jgi:hypothetical protein
MYNNHYNKRSSFKGKFMKKLICSTLLILAPTLSWAEFDPEFGMRMGYNYGDLSVDVEKTQELGGATVEDPQIYLQHDGAEYWNTPTVIATPSTGVCGVGYYSRPLEVAPDGLTSAFSEILNVHMVPLSKRFGKHFLEVDGSMTEPSLEAIVSQLENNGIAQLMAPGESREDVLLSLVDAQYVDGTLGVSGGILYSNIEDCLKVIHGVEP